MTKLRLIFKGGKGSGNFGHSGREGMVGGSSTSGSGGGNDIFYKDAIESVAHFPSKPADNLVRQAVDIAMAKKSFGNKTHDYIQEHTKLSDGVIQSILKAVKDRYRTEESTRSSKDARIDSILRITNSEGKTRGRKFS